MSNVNSLKKLFNKIIILGLLIMGGITYLYHQINSKSTKILFHRTFVLQNLNIIEFNISEAHLWITEYSQGDVLEKNKINYSLNKIDKSFKELLAQEKSKQNTNTSKFRDNKYILKNLKELQKEFFELRYIMKEFYIHENKVGSYEDIYLDKKYNQFLKSLNSFDDYLNETFKKVSKEFKNTKDFFYILILGLFIIWLSITIIVMNIELKRIKKIQLQNELLKQQEENRITSISQMLSNIAHQWRQPLNAISLLLGSLKLKISLGENIDNKELEKTTNEALDKLNYLSQTIDDFKEFFENNIEGKKEDFYINQTVKKALEAFIPELKKEKIQFILSLDKIKITENECLLLQVFINLLNNSIEAFKLQKELSKKLIFIDITLEDEQIIITFKDSAKGIEQKYLEKICEPYFTTKHQARGTGLGLFFTYEVITKHFNGEVTIKNRDYVYKDSDLKGAEVVIKLPRNFS